jgi:hypothetical protein
MEHWTLALAILGALTVVYFILVYVILLIEIAIAVMNNSDAMAPIENFYEIIGGIKFEKGLII